MNLLLYNVLLLAALTAGCPWWLWRLLSAKKYREGFTDRVGKVPAWLKSKAAERPVIWLHAVSVGEVLAVSRLVDALDRVFPGFQLMISTTTRTGQNLARQRFGANRVFYCPLDLPWAVHAYLDTLNPRMLILAETEFWPNLLTGCFTRQIPVAVVNARISDRSWPRYRALQWFWQPLLGRLGRAMAQTPKDADRLIAIGCEAASVTIAGNLKFDVRAVQIAEAARLLEAKGAGLRLIVAGSTLEGEETALLETWPRLLALEPQLAMVLAPRHPERFGAVADLLDQTRLNWFRRSRWTGKRAEELPPIRSGAIVLLDSIGELASVYSLASIAFVGGSLVPAGGHNPLEPAQFGVPVVMGPHYANFRAIVEDLRAHDALRIARREELGDILAELLTDRTRAQAMGARAKRVFDAQAGATERTVRALQSLMAREAQPA